MRSTRNRWVVVAALALATAAGVARADAPGQSFWVPGQVAGFSALPANAGWTVELQPYYYSGDTSKSSKKAPDIYTNFDYDTNTTVLQANIAYGFADTIWGGRVTVGLMTGWGRRSTTLNATVNGLPGVSGDSTTTSDNTSINPYASIAWRDDSNHFKVYLMGGFATGSFNSATQANVGLGYNAVDGGVAYTYFDRKTGWEASVLAGATYNGTNSEWAKVGGQNISYQNGADWHVDYSVSKYVTPHWSLGGVGYFYGQFTNDEIQGQDKNNVAKSHIAGIGPQATYVFRVNGRDWTANIRAYYEFWSQYRPEGYTVMGTISMPLGSF